MVETTSEMEVGEWDWGRVVRKERKSERGPCRTLTWKVTVPWVSDGLPDSLLF